jgi:co-chaperonin GroES (HSP10)
MKVLFNNILLKNPFFKKEKTTIKVSNEIQQEMLMGEIEKVKELEVAEAGSACAVVKQGDKVYVDTVKVMNSPRVTIAEVDYFIMRESDVILIY